MEEDLLLEWIVDLDFLAIHSSCPPSSAKNVDASKIVVSTFGDNHPVRTSKAAPFPFGVVALTGYNGTSFLMIGE